jgi:hypothetical protein
MTKYPYDPRFPDRPQTEDFYTLSQAANSLDGMAETGMDLAELSEGEGVDDDSMVYMARGRTWYALQQLPEPEDDKHRHAQHTATWIDGFTVGLRFAHAKALKELVDGNRRMKGDET